MKAYPTDTPEIAVIFPSRGLAFSQTCEELLDNLDGYDYEIFFSHQLSLPNCFNKPLMQALSGEFTHFWLVEDDMVLPKNTLKTMLEECPKNGAVMCDYPMDADGKAAILRDPNNKVIYGGTGCLLASREFLQMYEYPIFRSESAWDMRIGEIVEVKPRKVKGDVYGLHDVNFSLEAYRRGTPIKVSKVKCSHRKMKQLGASATNAGQHQVETWIKLKINKLPRPPKGQFVPVEIDGEIVNVRPNSPLARGYKPRYVEFLG